MQLPRPVVHGVYALCSFACAKPGPTLPAREVARRMTVPTDQAAKLLQMLAVAGLVLVRRGRNGGYRLARPLHTISVGDVAVALGFGRATTRFQPRQCSVKPGTHCTVHEGLVQLRSRFWALIDSVTLADLAGSKCRELEMGETFGLSNHGIPFADPATADKETETCSRT